MANRSFDSDALDSDGLEDVLELSLQEYKSKRPHFKNISAPQVGPSNKVLKQPKYLEQHDLRGKLSKIETEISSIDDQIKKLEAYRKTLQKEKRSVIKELDATRPQPQAASLNVSKGKARESPTIDYNEDFEWTPMLRVKMKQVFGIDDFRLCQAGVCNANMENRDIICVMPTGGGKSLTYQLPALMVPGCTLVVSPLVSLITDQILHLREAGVDAVMLTGSTPKEELREVTRRFNDMAHGTKNIKEIKLCYVTPEKLSKSQSFFSQIQKLYDANKLARVVIDEAHCVSHMGHDFRPDYKKLSAIRQFFPTVPIMALSATCPPDVMKDLLAVLNMKPAVDGRAAPLQGTVYFSSPLYRKNLHYSIQPKRPKSEAVIRDITKFILEKHPNHSGIIYVLTKKDAETVAEELQKHSQGKIKTGVYHADVKDQQKLRLHERWRRGDVQVVCATIAFGMGIDKADVRFVIHHSISKSLDGFYQESGRAGRDGKDADCVLYYREQDAAKMIGITCSEPTALRKVMDMLRFAKDMEQCRKIRFANYFSMSSNLSLASWTTDDEDALARCGHCDNCKRLEGSLSREDVTTEAWQILKIAEYVQRQSGRVTLGQLSDLARGTGKGEFGASGGGKRKANVDKIPIDVRAIAEGTVSLSRDDTEALCNQLLLDNYLGVEYSANAFTVNVYYTPGQKAIGLTRYSLEELQEGKGPRISRVFSEVGKRRLARPRQEPQEMDEEDGGMTLREMIKRTQSKGNASFPCPTHPEDEGGSAIELDNDDDEIVEDSVEEEDWDFSLEPDRRATKVPRKSTSHLIARRAISQESTSTGVIEISD